MELKETLTLISILMAFALFCIGYLERRRGSIRKQTLDFLFRIIADDGELNRANLAFACWINEGRTLEDDELNVEERKTLVKLLDYYDLISDTAMKGVIDKEMVIVHLGGRIRNTFERLKAYIYHRRKELNRPGLYKPLEKFVVDEVGNREV